ncbi:coiled-coil domain-containing protein 137 isoform X2 [Polyodon spathula]|uniref:coiled-coil domain-containing protein 137 isoform X2 n=1 Tax=Polyodon spathula TaxID=7913 RepID=UPI001B7E334F|nr:coiled-coil domain-containing protein 137 isoform X2 [Polyodon spathula]
MGKHRKIKAVDPFYHGPRKDQLQGKGKKSDVKPHSMDNLEHIPFRLREIMRSKERMKKQQNKKMTAVASSLTPTPTHKPAPTPKPSPKPASDAVQLQADIPVPRFRKRRQESEAAFMNRMDRETQHVMFLTKNQLIREPEREQPLEKGKSENKKEYDRSRLNRLLKKKEDRKELREEKEKFIDTVKFGDVAMAPPTLTVKPRKAQTRTEGRMKGLLLTSLMGTPVAAATGSVKSSMARQRMMLEERERVVKAYRDLKKIKHERLLSNTASLKRQQNLK